MAITFEREQQATIQAYHRNRHDPRIKDLGVDIILNMVRIFMIINDGGRARAPPNRPLTGRSAQTNHGQKVVSKDTGAG